MPGPSCTLSRSQMRVNHFDDTEPGQPGITSRTGAWMFGNGWAVHGER